LTQPVLIQTTSESSWQEILAGTIKNTEDLCRQLKLERDALPANHPLLKNFPVRVPAPFLSRMETGNPYDPLLLQVFPGTAEADNVSGFNLDPLEESSANPLPGILHKYKGRALLLVTSSCAVHCRYCFRRHFPYADNQPGRQHWKKSLDYIANDTSLSEIIFSGGDSLTLPDAYLGWFIDELSRIDHVKRIRFHTRLPVMIPQRITDSLCTLLANPRFRTILVLHSNHPREFDIEVDEACRKLKNAGVLLLNQSVLLKGINDSPKTLAALSERLFTAGVMPYYLHLLDRVTGAAHFEVNEKEASGLMKELQAVLPGYLVPKLVREIPGESAKTLAM
jgi:EF-P beta-lysylation protein EpmB